MITLRITQDGSMWFSKVPLDYPPVAIHNYCKRTGAIAEIVRVER